MLVLSNCVVEDGVVVQVSPDFVNAYASHYDYDRMLPLAPVGRTKNIRCRSMYHANTMSGAKKAVWARGICRTCEALEHNWTRGRWPRLTVLDRHVPPELARIIRCHCDQKLGQRLHARVDPLRRRAARDAAEGFAAAPCALGR